MNAFELENLCRKIAPGDIGSRPIYVALASEMPEPLRPNAGTWGYQSQVLDISLSAWLKSVGRWRGRGPCFALNDLAIQAAADDLAASDPELCTELYRQRIVGTALHELAHVLSSPIDLRPVPQAIESEIAETCQTSVERFVVAENPDTSIIPAWLGHEARFIRSLAHVAQRYESLTGDRLPEGFLFASANYELSRLNLYRDSLTTETAAFASQFTFHDLRTCQPTEAFIAVWKRDLHRWWLDHESIEDAPLRIAAAMAPFVHARRVFQLASVC